MSGGTPFIYQIGGEQMISDVISTTQLRRMFIHAKEQFMKSWNPKDAEFWKNRMKKLKAIIN